MCKLLMFAGITEATEKAAFRFVLASLPSMTEHDRDGVGYAAVRRDNGELFGERWVNTKSAFKSRNPMTEIEERLLASHCLAVDVEESYNSFGHRTDGFSAFCLHSRFATCAVSLQNTHPFVAEDTALIHNGVITNPNSFPRKTTCDSEAILSGYLFDDVAEHIDAVQDLAQSLEGYYACGVLSRDRDGERILDIFKSDTASLFVSWVDALNTWVYATSAETIRKASKKIRSRCSVPQAIKAGWLIRVRASTGEVMGLNRFSPRPRILTNSYVGHALHGWALDKDDEVTDASVMMPEPAEAPELLAGGK